MELAQPLLISHETKYGHSDFRFSIFAGKVVVQKPPHGYTPYSKPQAMRKGKERDSPALSRLCKAAQNPPQLAHIWDASSSEDLPLLQI